MQVVGRIAFRMLVVADFGGHAARGEIRPGRDLRPFRVDLDNLLQVVRKIAPSVPISVGREAPFTVAIEDLEDFHPDHLYSHLDFFSPMRELRRQLHDPKAFARAAALLGKASEPASSTAAVPADDADLARLLGRPSSTAPSAAGVAATVDNLIRQAVAPHIVGKSDPRQAALVTAVDGMTGELMRAVLHDPGFQGVEAVWRGLDRLLRTLELDESLQVFVLDASSAELAADFASVPDLGDSAMYRILVGHTQETPWSLLVNGNPCSRRQEDISLLARLGTLAQAVDAAVVAGMDWQAWANGAPSLEELRACSALRCSATAHAIAVAVPSFLLRLPYGKGTEPIEKFVFTEQSTPPVPGGYLWGSGAFAVAESLARSYAAAGGWDFSPGDVSVVTDLPVYVFTQDGESVETPVAQAWLPEAKIDELIKDGLVPLVSVRGRGELRLPRVQSLASPPASLAGRWR